jgi:hypothetical protein
MLAGLRLDDDTLITARVHSSLKRPAQLLQEHANR